MCQANPPEKTGTLRVPFPAGRMDETGNACLAGWIASTWPAR